MKDKNSERERIEGWGRKRRKGEEEKKKYIC